MRPVDVKKFKYQDNLASKRRQRLQIKTISIGVIILTAIAGIGYGLFYMPWLQVDTLKFEGVSGLHQEEVKNIIEGELGRHLLGVPIGRDILFVDAKSLGANLSSKLSFLEHASVKKNYPNTLEVTTVERQAEGVWCFTLVSPAPSFDCRYFDHGGITFGHAIQSSGVLLLNVDDMRTQSASASLVTVDRRFLEAIQIVVPTLTHQDVKVKNITIPPETYTEFDVLAGDGYLVKFSLDSNIEGQLEVFRIFRTQKMADGTLHPQYVDLRFDGRVYFK